MKAAQHHSLSAASLAITRALLLLAVMLLWPENRVWAFELAPQIASAETSHATPSSIRENLPLAVDPASGCCVAAEEAGRGGTALARSLGQAGEDAVGIAGPKVSIEIPGSGQIRIPDALTDTTLTEVKNVGSLSYTQQLRDFTTYSQANGLDFQLYVRPSTQLSGPLQQAITNGQINLNFIPGAP